jgi:hypothetical protein
VAFLDDASWQGKVCSGGWKRAGGGETPVLEPATGSQLGSTGIVHINDQTVDDAPNTPVGGVLAPGTGARFGGTASLDAFTDARWVTLRGEIASYPF